MIQESGNRRAAVVCALLLLSIGTTFFPVIHHGFVNYDDQDYITENPQVQKGLSRASVAWAFTSTWAANWHPLTWLSHMLDWQIYGPNAGGHHASSLILHCANTLLLLLVLQSMTKGFWRSSFVASLFALHPLHVESVAWASERKDVLSTLFFMLTLWAYSRFARPGSTTTAQMLRLRRPLWYCLSIFLYACGLMSKPMLVTLPFVLLLLDYWPLNRFEPQPGAQDTGFLRRSLKLIGEKVPFLTLSMVSSIITFNIQRRAGAMTAIEVVPIDARLENALFSYLSYGHKMLWPQILAPFYPYQQDYPVSRLLVAGLMMIGVTSAAIVWAKKAPYFIVGWLWYLGTLVPVIGLVQVGAQSMADRYSYIPLVGLFIAMSWGVSDFAKSMGFNQRVLATLGAGAIAGCVVISAFQVRTWKNSLMLFSHAVRVTKGNYLAHHSLGAALVEAGDLKGATTHFREAVRIKPGYAQAQSDLGLALVLQGQLEEGISHYRVAIQARPGLDKPHYNLGRALVAHGELEEARAEYEAALSLNPGYVEARTALALLLVQQGKIEPATTQLEELLRHDPNNPSLHLELARLLKAAGKTEEAIAHFEAGIRLKPDDPEARENLGLLQAQAGNVVDAIVQFREALRLQPTVQLHYEMGLAYVVSQDRKQAAAEYRTALAMSADYLPALNDLAWILATDPNPELRDGPEAVRLARKACELDGGKEARFWGTLDAAYAETGQFDKAIATATRTRDLAAASGQPELAAAAERRLKLYASKQPFRQE